MSTTRRGGAARNLLAFALAVAFLGACAPAPVPSPSGGPASPVATGDAVASGDPAVTPRPAPGHELYGFLPYWEMDDTIADHLGKTPLTTLALFSVTDTSKGALNTRQTGYKRITGEPGTRVIREAHDRGVRVDLVFTSFGLARNRALFANEARQDATIAALVALVGSLALDGICVDIEGLDPLSLPEYGSFVRRLRAAVVAADVGDRVTVSTSAGGLGAAMAAAAVTAGADRVFLMGYDYRVAGSSPGATSPLDRSDGDRDLPWSIDLYAAAGVPPERTLLGLPLYGMTWPVAYPAVGAPETGRGEAWIPRRHRDVLADASIVPVRDPQEMVEVYLFGSDGSVGAPPQEPSGAPPREPSGAPSQGSQEPSGAGSPDPSISHGDVSWSAVYVDSPATLAPKMALADVNGFAGVGFWAIGYERGLPGYTALMERFVAGEPLQ
jgi:spore germination protein YaaH